MNRDRLVSQLTADEGKKLKPYRCTQGKLSIGVGRNLDDVGISDAEARYLLDNDIDRAIRGLDLNFPWWRNLDDVRQEILVNMMFNMGWDNPKTPQREGLSGFVNTLAAIRDGKYATAATGMRQSKWFRQVGDRAKRLADAMETGRF